MICNVTYVNEGGTIVFSLDFLDENGISYGVGSLESVRFQVCDSSGDVVNNRTFSSGLLTGNVIVLSGADLESPGVRYLGIKAVYNSSLGAGLTLSYEQKFIINDLKNL